MNNIENFRKEYECEWKSNDTPLTPNGMCLLHIYKRIYKNCQWIHNQYEESPNANLEFLNHVIHRICYELEINSEKIFEVSPSGKVRPNKFEKYINKESIPEIYKSEYKIVWDRYCNLSSQLRKEREEYDREKDRKLEFIWLNI